MRMIKQLTTNKFLNIKEVSDPSNNVHGYQFAERRGVDSIAFICWDKRATSDSETFGKFLVNKEYTPPTNEFHFRAFGGSLDKNVEMIGIVKDEVKEEAGFDVKDKNVHYLGKVFVSTQMNQYCHLYFVAVNGGNNTGRKPENKIEEMAMPVWRTEKEIMDGDDWKAIVILSKIKDLKK